MAEQKRATFEAGVFSTNQVAGTRDADSGVYYGLYGAQPSENEEAEEQFSAARACAPVGGFRVYHDSSDTALQFSVAAGLVIYRGAVVSYAGGNNIALGGGNDVAHYVYLALPDATLTVSAVSWPTTPHVRIAVITPTAGAWNWAGHVDHRRTGVQRAVAEPAGGTHRVIDLTEGIVLAAADSKTVLTNLGAAALVTQNLPAAAAGLEFIAVVRDADGLKLVAAAGDTIRIGTSVTPAAGYIESTELGASIRLMALDDTAWVAIGTPQGTWTVSS
jgi:hypothetical protein